MDQLAHDKEFNALVQEAIAQPERADLSMLWQQLDQMLEKLPQEVWLSVAGEAIAQFAGICAARAEFLLDDWQSRYSPRGIDLTEPVLTDDLLAGILRHTMSLNLEPLMEDIEPQHRNRAPSADESIVGDVGKDELFEMLDQMELKQMALQTAYEESISDWSAAIRQWVDAQAQPIDLATLLANIKLSPVKAWLGLLLADPGYRWQHHWKTDEEFYSPRCAKLLSRRANG
jgi:hypothetical protein